MKTAVKLACTAALTLGLVSSTFADGWRHDRYNDRHYRNHRQNDWVGPVVALGLAGLIIGAAASERPPAQPPIYFEEPPRYAQPRPAEIWYYCQSSRQYYPYVNYCAEAWLPVPATPR